MTWICSPAALEAAFRSATSGPSGAAPPLIASPTCFETAFRSALSGLALGEQAPAGGVELERGVDERRILALVGRALADDVGLVAEPLQADAHETPPTAAAPDAARARSMTKSGSRLASSQPARGPLGLPRNAR